MKAALRNAFLYPAQGVSCFCLCSICDTAHRHRRRVPDAEAAGRLCYFVEATDTVDSQRELPRVDARACRHDEVGAPLRREPRRQAKKEGEVSGNVRKRVDSERGRR